MQRVGINKWLSQTKQYPAGIITIILAVLLITPVCGYLFVCGCTWPGLGLHTDCNYYHSAAVHKCPWCVSVLAASLSIMTATISAYLLAMSISSLPRFSQAGLQAIITAVSVGLFAYLLLLLLAAWISARLLDYPFFLQYEFLS